MFTLPQTPDLPNQEEPTQPALHQNDRRNAASASGPAACQYYQPPPDITVTSPNTADDQQTSDPPDLAVLPGQPGHGGPYPLSHEDDQPEMLRPLGVQLNDSLASRADAGDPSSTEAASQTVPLDITTSGALGTLQDVDLQPRSGVDMYQRLEQDLAELASRSRSTGLDNPLGESMPHEDPPHPSTIYNVTPSPSRTDNGRPLHYYTGGEPEFDPYIDGTSAATQEEYYHFLYATHRHKPGVSSLLTWMQQCTMWRDNEVYQNVRQHCLGVFVWSGDSDQPFESHEIDPHRPEDIWRHRHLLTSEDNPYIRSRVFVLDDAPLGAIELIGRATHIDPRILCMHLANTLSATASGAWNLEQIPLIHRKRERLSQAFALPFDPRIGAGDPWADDPKSLKLEHV